MVSKGNSFRVECSVHAEIDYCWLRHPNGTAVPVTVPDGAADRSKGSRYRYTGDGLSFGQCHVTVDEAVVSDTGPWLCALGLRNDRREMYGTVNITVSGESKHSSRIQTFQRFPDRGWNRELFVFQARYRDI
jgi:hypothetical protein